MSTKRTCKERIDQWKVNLKDYYYFVKENAKEAAKDGRFWNKFACWLLTVLNFILWRAPNKGWSGMMGLSQAFLWACTVPAYFVITFFIMIMYIFIAELPGLWFNRVFMCAGFWLFGTTGVVGIFNSCEIWIFGKGSFYILPFIQGLINVAISAIMFTDELMNEQLLPTRYCFQGKDKKEKADDTDKDLDDVDEDETNEKEKLGKRVHISDEYQ